MAKGSPQESKKTPYQGKKRCFGHFKCPKCDHEWASASSWANIWQQCFECKTKVYPHAQWELKKGKKSKAGKKPHLEDLCQKCRIIGCCCLTIVEGKRRKKKHKS